MKPLTLFVCLFVGTSAFGENLTLTSGGKVSVELVFSDAAFTNTMSLVVPAGARWGIAEVPDPTDPTGVRKIKLSGCVVEPSTTAVTPGEELLSEKRSQRGCRVQLDADTAAAGIQPFAAGTVLQFAMCAIADATPPVCDYIWSSVQALNNGTGGYSNDPSLDHLDITTVVAGKVFELAWEDLPGGTDFNDLIARVSVDADSDGDGLWDDWEDTGIDTNGDGNPDVILGSDKYRKDIFLRLDYMNCAVGPQVPTPSGCAIPHSHEPSMAAINKLKAAFNNAPVPNVYGANVRPNGINLHIEIGSAVAHSEIAYIAGICDAPAGQNNPPAGNFDTIKDLTFPASSGKRFSHRYGLLAHSLMGGGSTGCGELPGNDFIVTLGQPPTPPPAGAPPQQIADYLAALAAQPTKEASTTMHELGHALGLFHGGFEPVNGKPNYLSVMNYNFQLNGIPQQGGGTPRIDYSAGGASSLTEGSLNENSGIGLGSMATSDITQWMCPSSNIIDIRTGPAGGPINWDCVGAANNPNVNSDVNGDRFCIQRSTTNPLTSTVPPAVEDQVVLSAWINDGTNRICNTPRLIPDRELRKINTAQIPVLSDFDDWEHLVYEFQTSVNFDHGVHLTESPDPEPDLIVLATILGPEPGLTMSAAVSGSTVTYTLLIKNDSTSPALNVVLSDVFPAQISAITCVATAGGVCGGSANSRTVSFTTIGGGTTAMVTFTGQLSCVPSGTTTIVNTARITATKDRVGGNNIASASISATACSATSLPISINQSVVTLNRATGRYLQTVTLTNTGTTALTSLAYAADYLPAGVAMVSPSGTTAATSPAGSPYKEVGAIPAGATATVSLEFTRTGTPAITYVPRILGPGPR